MKSMGLAPLVLLGALVARVSAFPLQSPFGGGRIHGAHPTTALASQVLNTINTEENAPRDTNTLEEWAASYGVQRADGVQLTQTNNDGLPIDVGVMTTQDIPANSPVLFVPSSLTLSSFQAQQELGPIQAVEDLFGRIYGAHQLPQFYLFLKILTEYERGDQSPWLPWLNALPRYFSTGASMTHFCCSECLPPLVGQLALSERTRFSQFYRALKYVDWISDATKDNRKLCKWAFAVVYTRGLEVGENDVRIVPMVDMFNHGTNTEIQISYDEEGNCYAYSTYDIPAGSPLRMSYTNGDNTNPSLLFARYGFLDETSPATFCKLMIPYPSEELVNMGYSHSRMLFYKDTGGVSEEVWDVLLYQLLEKIDPDIQLAFYQAHRNGDYQTKQSMHQQYYPQTSAALRDHVDTFLNDLDALSAKADGRDLNVHPRLPLIRKHNEFVKQTFWTVRAQL